MRTLSPWPAIVIVSAAAAAYVAFLATSGPIRPVIVLWFLLVCPGMILVRFFHLREPLFEWTLALALSLVVDAFVAGLLVYAGRWSPSGAFAILLGLTVCGALAQEVSAFLIQRRKPR